MNMQPTHASARAMAALFCAAGALAACGGGGDDLPIAGAPAPVPAPAPAPAPGTGTVDTVFATPMNATDTSEAGTIETYAFAEKANEQTPGAAQFADGAVSHGAALTATQAFAGVALRAYAPGNTGAAPVTAFDASTYTQLKIQLRSGTDALLTVKLQPAPVSADGCTATAQAVVSATLTELTIDLNDTSFVLPDYCNGAGTPVGTVKGGLFAIDVINPATNAGAHDLAIGTVKLAK
jgi:hypothetical protein